RAVIPLIQSMGASLRLKNQDWEIGPGVKPIGFEFDARHSPDLFPILAVLAAGASGPSSIRGLGRLKHKESDRAQSIAAMLSAFGVDHKMEGDYLKLPGGHRLRGARIQSFNDHRIVMAASIAA